MAGKMVCAERGLTHDVYFPTRFFTASLAMSDITIYHNPKCSTSRKVLEMIRAAGIEPQVIEYLKTPPDRATLKKIIAGNGQPVRDIMRRRGTSYDEQDLDNPKWSDAQLIDLMLADPVLINRPIVVTPLGTRLCRPVEKLQEILPQA